MEKPLIELLKERRKENLLKSTLTVGNNEERAIFLSEDYTNFDFIICKVRSIEDSNAIQTIVLAVDISESSSISIIGINPESYAAYGRIYLSASLVDEGLKRKINLKCIKAYGWSGLILEKVYGIKY